jgi:3',5'-cyclic AMP phosphodiesterase CpdA
LAAILEPHCEYARHGVRVRPFALLQLSDLHFGPNSRFAGVDMDGLAGRCADAVRDARGQLRWGEDVGLVLVTGDIAEAARSATSWACSDCRSWRTCLPRSTSARARDQIGHPLADLRALRSVNGGKPRLSPLMPDGIMPSCI